MGFKTTDNQSLKRHKKESHDKIKDLFCVQCKFQTSYQQVLDNHISAAHRQIIRQNCRHCSFQCTNAGDLEFHMNSTHQEIKPFKIKFKLKKDQELNESDRSTSNAR